MEYLSPLRIRNKGLRTYVVAAQDLFEHSELTQYSAEVLPQAHDMPYFAHCSIIRDVRGNTQHNRATVAENAVENEGQQDET